MAKSASLFFPFEENSQLQSLRRAETVNETLMSAFKCYLLTAPGQRRGNPIGSFLPSLKHRLIPDNALAGLADELKKEMTDQFPGVTFTTIVFTKVIEDNVSKLKVTIQFGTPISDISEFQLIV